MEWEGSKALQSGKIRQAIARSHFAAIRPVLDIRFGHDLDPFEGGGERPPVASPTVRGRCAQVASAAAFNPVVLNKGLGIDRPPSERVKR